MSPVNPSDPHSNNQSTVLALETSHNPIGLSMYNENSSLEVPAVDTMSQPQQMTNTTSENWEGFIMDRLNRKLLLKTSDLGKKYCKVKSRVKFLQECKNFQVIPPTCRSKHTHPVQYSSPGQARVQSIQKKASLELLRNAICEEIKEMNVTRKLFKEHVSSLLDSTTNPVIKSILNSKLRAALKSCSKTSAHDHRQRLVKLLVEDHQEFSESRLVQEHHGDCSVLSQSVMTSNSISETLCSNDTFTALN